MRESVKQRRDDIHWRLVDAGGYSVKVGDMFKDVQNRIVKVVGGSAPHTSNSSGRVTLEYEDGHVTDGYPQVIRCKWIGTKS